jgi:hypothetical protein
LPGPDFPDLHSQLADLYANCDCHHLPDLGGDEDIDRIASSLANMVADIWKQKGLTPGLINPEVTRIFASKLWKGTTKGYGFDLSNSIDYDTPDYNMLSALKKHVWHFSGAKNYQQLRELSASLLDDDGKLRSKSSFYEAALKINNTQLRYLRAEYELAVSGGQMAGKWVDIERDKETLPLLQFDAVLDSQTTGLCRSLDGVILPVEHAFWKQYYPPNHHGCRSTVRQLASGVVTPETAIPTADIPKMFQTNLGQQHLIFPKDHPYFNGAPKKIYEQAIKLLPYNDQFETINHKGYGVLREHTLNDAKSKDYETVKLIAKELAETENVDMLPRFDFDNDPARTILIPDAKVRKYPDLRVSGKLWEVEETGVDANINTLKNAIRNGSHQAERVIVKLNHIPEDRELNRVLGSKWKDHKELQEIWFRMQDGSYKKFPRPVK